MSRFREKMEAQTKQIIGQMIGDQELVQEGLAQQREATSGRSLPDGQRDQSAPDGSSRSIASAGERGED